MAKSGKGDKKSPKKKADSSIDAIRGWIIRSAILAVAAILMIMASMDYNAKTAATSTADTWRKARNAKDEHSDLKKSEFDRIPFKGSPTVTSAKAEANSIAAVKVDSYTWKGTFRNYTVKVYLGMGNDPAVEQIDGPGEAK